jgi:protocatechuate 3,4-dioxygenase beta subunit
LTRDPDLPYRARAQLPFASLTMSNSSNDPSLLGTRLSRRDWLGVAGQSAIGVVVSQTLLGRITGERAAASSDRTVATGASSGTPSDARSCVLTASLTEGPYYVDEKLLRSDIRTDPVTGVVSQGVPLSLAFSVSRVAGRACTPLTGANLDVWHCDAGGLYSDESANGTSGKKYLRGYQITDAHGLASFTTIYPGWYGGRAVHVHFKLRLFAGVARTYEFSSQFFFAETLTSTVHALSPYAARGMRDTVNSRDRIYNSLTTAERAALTLQASRSGNAYAGTINLGVQVG